MNFPEYLKKIDTLQAEIDKLGPLDPARQKQIDDYYKVEITYNSLALSGNTLSREEVAAIVLGKNDKNNAKDNRSIQK